MTEITKLRKGAQFWGEEILPGTHFDLVVDGVEFDEDRRPRALYVAVTGTATITDWSGHAETSVTLIVGYHPISVKKISSISSAVIYAVR
jgi:hypothetical protein